MSAEIPKPKSWAVKIEGPLGIIVSGLIISCLTYAIVIRGWHFFKLPILLATIFSTISFFISIKSCIEKNFSRKLLSGAKAALGTAAFAVVVMSIILGTTFSLERLWDYASSNITSSYKTSFLFGIATFIVGSLFFLIRTIWRVTYGISEIIAGVCIASYRAFGTNEWLSSVNMDLYLVVLTAGVYLVVRGLDNVAQGIKQSNDPIVRAWRWLKSQIFVSNPDKVSEIYGDKQAD